eukprot:TRINITY_DN4784_c0_g2_i1.p3 TRINITY_DN4784_c0_g2~~TRINITY_DN4784_c0_g2_i1.p3  ORF type:complete len:188 (+),score=41.81 TRINITY_DN4784_c0_g2_i1:81-566(+)
MEAAAAAAAAAVQRGGGLGRFLRPKFRSLRRVDIDSWHRLSDPKRSVFLRDLSNTLLADAAPGLIARPGDHVFGDDRFYWLSRPTLPGSFDAGLATVRRRSHSSRLVLALFEARAEEPLLLYATDRICVDRLGRPVPVTEALERAFRATAAEGPPGAQFGL